MHRDLFHLSAGVLSNGPRLANLRLGLLLLLGFSLITGCNVYHRGNSVSSIELEVMDLVRYRPGNRAGGGVDPTSEILSANRHLRLDQLHPDGFRLRCLRQKRIWKQSSATLGVDASGRRLRHRSLQPGFVDALGVGTEANAHL